MSTGYWRPMISTLWTRYFKKLTLKDAGSTLVLTSGASASFTYLVEPHLGQEASPLCVVDITSDTARSLDWSQYKKAVVVRYAPDWLMHALRQFQRAGGQVVYFMDDDLMDPAALSGLPPNYRRRITAQATAQRRKIEAICTEYWVSTPHLARKYAAWSPKVLVPVAPAEELRRITRVSVCYHGTSSHMAELEWLKGVVATLHAKSQCLNFEVFGDHATNRLFRSLPRIAVLHPMSWNNYLDYTASISRDIGLAPLLPSQFNDARGPTKFFDFVRMGAVGLYSDVSPYRGFIRDGVDGILLPNDPDLWVEAIVSLAQDTPRRQRMAAGARERALALGASVSVGAPHCE